MRVEIIMPMAGRGSRFSAAGERRPKPLVQLLGHPFFAWAARGLVDRLPDARLTFVVLAEHERDFDIAAVIRGYFPMARVVAIQEVTRGALDTALVALPHVAASAPLFVNDCDHFFGFSGLPQAIDAMTTGRIDGALCHFASSSANFSYARYDGSGALIETAEKRVISRHAIAGAYGFRSATVLAEVAAAYRTSHAEDETFISGVYNELAHGQSRVEGFELDFHVPFGTPQEYAAALSSPRHFEETPWPSAGNRA